MNIEPDVLMNIANSLGSGYLKHGKALSMCMTLKGLPQIVEDDERFKKYLHNCLDMEGFSDWAVEEIFARLKEEK